MTESQQISLAAYTEFLKRKASVAPQAGFPCEASEVNPLLKPHARDIVCWAVRLGRAGIFTSFGLHKTSMQLEILRLVMAKSGAEFGLINLPLGVRQEFFKDARMMATGEGDRFTDEQRATLRAWLSDDPARAHWLHFIRQDSEIDTPGIYLTNYESIRERKIDPKRFGVASNDEAGNLRSFGSKTFSEMLFGEMQRVPYRFVATAVPSPNQFLELLAYAQYLGVMDIGEAKTRFFQRNSEKADDLTIRPHKEQEFWLWCATWAIFLRRPSDLGYSDEGYELPSLDIRWHEVPTDHADAGHEKNGQGRLIKNTALGVSEASREKRASLKARVAKMMEIRAEDPGAHRIIWHDLEDERREIEAAIPDVVTVYGNKDLDAREQDITRFADGKIAELAAKPVMLGSGVNFQRHCAHAIYLGIGFKFNDFIQSVHRLHRFLQTRQVRLDLIYTEAEREVRRRLLAKWARHERMMENMSQIIREYGLSHAAIQNALTRTLGVERQEARGENWLLAKNDSIFETASMESDSVGLAFMSIPFSGQYEYTAALEDFGHTESDEKFEEQMDFLTPELYRTLKPGRVLAVHVKDRVTPGAMTGLGFQTVSPFMCKMTMHYIRHGFAYGGHITVATDVVRENNQTYRLGWTEQCKDGSRMGVGLPEYVLIFRKPPTDNSDGYADDPVAKTKEEYSRSRWQIDAHGFWRSNGNRYLTTGDFKGVSLKTIYNLFRKFSLDNVYDYEHHVALGEFLDGRGQLKPDFMVLAPQSWHRDIWTDIMRARTLNGAQAAKGKEKHICPLPIDIVDRVINRFSSLDEWVYDPLAGLGTVPARAVRLGRRGRGCELNPGYWQDSTYHACAEEQKRTMPTFFDLLKAEEEEGAFNVESAEDLQGEARA